MPEAMDNLRTFAVSLNSLSDTMTAQVARIEAELKKLNLGVSAWVTVREEQPSMDLKDWNKEELGYVRIGKRWGVALKVTRTVDGAVDEQFSAFGDSPRSVRIRSVEYFPALMAALVESANSMITKLSPEVEAVARFADALEGINLGR